jgi:acyl-CoA reductase-like NAD-dependent aldehyde dehydrogenase
MTVIGTDLNWHERAPSLVINGHVIARVAATDAADADLAVAAARRRSASACSGSLAAGASSPRSSPMSGRR